MDGERLSADETTIPVSPRALRQRLESLSRAGVTFLPKASPRPTVAATAAAAAVASPASRVSPPAAAASSAAPTPFPAESMAKRTVSQPAASSPAALPRAAPTPAATTAGATVAGQSGPLSHEARLVALDVIRHEVAQCTRCPHLAATRTQTVFGVGNIQPRLVFFGEAPGADEDAQGEPFVGRAGQLLTKIIEACTLRREDVYILNVLKCRPPENRPPEPVEVTNCRPYFERQLEILRPEFICCLGTTAARALLKSDLPIGKLRRKFFDYQGAQVICTYHPSYLLRNPAAKRDVWEDMKMLLEAMGIPLPSP